MPATYTIKGKLTDSATGDPLAHAEVRIVAGSISNFGKKAVTNSSGRYKMRGVTPEKIILEASLCYAPKEKMLTVTGNATVDLKLDRN